MCIYTISSIKHKNNAFVRKMTTVLRNKNLELDIMI